MITKYLLSIYLILLSGSIFAHSRSKDMALERALQFISEMEKTHGMKETDLEIAHVAKRQNEVYYYVFNKAEGGFIIVGGDEQARDILAYCSEGAFDYDQLPFDMKWVLNGYEQEIHYSIQKQALKGIWEQSSHRASNYYDRINVEPLLGSIAWGQSAPFNAFIPGNEEQLEPSEQWVTGCAATATAQVMKKWNWPLRGAGRLRYEYKGRSYAADFSNTYYDWNAMADTYQKSYSGTPSEKAVATLMYHIGVASRMQYKKSKNGGSVTYCQSIIDALTTHFGYADAQYCSRGDSSRTDFQWEEMIYQEMVAGRPVIYGGMDKYSSGGHGFVCDGYDATSNTFHINWGWNGKYNGYFALIPTIETPDPLSPSGTGEGGSENASWCLNQEAIIGIQPGDSEQGGIYCPEPLQLQNNGFATISDDYRVHFFLGNTSGHNITKTIYMVVFPVGGKWSSDICAFDELMIPAHSEIELEALFPGFDSEKVSEGNYYFSLMNYTDGKFFHVEAPLYITAPLHINLSISTDHWKTLCLPFDAEIPKGIKPYKIVNIIDDHIIKIESEKIEKDKPYLIYGDSGEYGFHGPTTPTGVFQQGLLYGLTGEPCFAPTGAFILQEREGNFAFHRVNSEDSYIVDSNTAYLLDGDREEQIIWLSESPESLPITEINTIKNDVYNLYGQIIHDYRGKIGILGKKTIVFSNNLP